MSTVTAREWRSDSRNQIQISAAVTPAVSHDRIGVPVVGTRPVAPENHASPSSASSTTLCIAATNRDAASLRSA